MDLIDNIKAILGINGLIFVYYSTLVIQDEYFADDKNNIENLMGKNEKPGFYDCVMIILFSNIIKNLNQHKITIIKDNIMKYYNFYLELYCKNIDKNKKDIYKKIAFISPEQDNNISQILIKEIEIEQNNKK